MISGSLSASGGLLLSVSPNATKPEEWNGWSGTFGASGGPEIAAIGGSVSDVGSGPLVYNGSFTAGPSLIPVTLSADLSYTYAQSMSLADMYNGLVDGAADFFDDAFALYDAVADTVASAYNEVADALSDGYASLLAAWNRLQQACDGDDDDDDDDF